MKKIKLLPHTADVGIEVEADSFQELFAGALLGMNEILKKGYCQNANTFPISHEITLESVDQIALLIDFLNLVLAYSNEKKALFCRVEFQGLNERFLKAEIFGEKVDSFEEDIKAATYHGAEIIKKGEKYEVQILFDI